MMNKEAEILMRIAERVFASTYKSDFIVNKTLTLERENSSTEVSLINAQKIKDAGYSVMDGKFSWDSNLGDWSMSVNFMDSTGTNMVHHLFRGFSIGFKSDGSKGFLDFGRIFGINFDEEKVMTKKYFSESGKDIPLNKFQ